MQEATTVRQNMMDDPNYEPYCGELRCMSRCARMPDNREFQCRKFYCRWTTKMDPEFMKRYRAKHNLVCI